MQEIFARYCRLILALSYRIKRGMESFPREIVKRMQETIVRNIIFPFVYSPKIEKCDPKLSERLRPRFLLLRYKFAHGDKRFGISNEEHAVSAPLKSAALSDVVEYYYDLNYPGGIFGDKGLVDLVAHIKPDIIILSSYNYLSLKQPHFETLKGIHSQCGIPFVFIWHDSSGDGAISAAEDLKDLIDLNIMLDSGNLAKHFSEKDRYLRLWVPLDFRVFHPGDGARDIPVSFVGSTGSYRNVRMKYLNYLKEKEIDICHTGGQLEQFIPQERYADILRQSRISLNFSFSVPGTYQLKARVFEILFSGALLMENENSETSQYFTPMVDYVAFDSRKDLFDKIRYYLNHEDERREIAHNGYMKATQEYNYKVFWDSVLARLKELKLL
jgi:hypothetical protein